MFAQKNVIKRILLGLISNESLQKAVVSGTEKNMTKPNTI